MSASASTRCRAAESADRSTATASPVEVARFHAWVNATTPSGVPASVVMSSRVCPGVRMSRIDGVSSYPSASRSSQRSPW